MQPRRPRFVYLAFTLTLFLFRAALAAAPWADCPGDLPQDPALTLGELPNGLRYAILPNAEPADRVSLRLLVSVGSLHENDNEQGLAHFIEHMAFRGTRSRPHGELIAGLERMGVSFGPDSAAFTSFNHTIYHLDLPDAGDGTIREALRVFREYASGIEFAPEDIERERGVILSEMATRDTGMARAGNRMRAFVWPTARENTRLPIGLEKQIRRFTQKQFRDFYHAWYRPGRIAIIAVGKLEPAAMRDFITAEFSSLAARAPARPEPPPLADLPSSKKLPPLEIFTHNELTGINVQHSCAWSETVERITMEKLVADMRHNLACYVFQRRMTLLARQPGATFGMPHVACTQIFPGMRATLFYLPGNLNLWPSILAASEQSLRTAREFGFTQTELDEAKADTANHYRQSVLYAPSRQSSMLAGQIAGMLLNGGGFSTPETVWRALEKPLADTTLEECNAAFAQLWGNAPVRTFMSATVKFAGTKTALVEKKLAESKATRVKPPPEIKALEFAYDRFGTPGRAAETKYVPEIDAHLVRFENNILLNFKHTEYEKNFVQVNLRIGLGKLEQPKDKPGIDMLASSAFLLGGLKRHTIAEITQLNTRHMLGMGFNIADDAANFSMRCPSGTLPFALKMLTAYITDAAFRPDALPLARPSITSMFQQTLSSPGARISSIVERTLTKDTRFGWPSFNEPASRTMAELHEWLSRVLAYDDIEMSIVGDTDLESALDAARNTLGALPVRAKRLPPKAGCGVTLVKPPPRPITVPANPTLKQGSFYFLWPVPDAGDTHRDRACHLLAAAVENAARACLREQLGASYTVSCNYVAHEAFDNFNYFLLASETSNAVLEKAMAAIKKQIVQLAANGIGEDEFLRAKKPFIEKYEQQKRTNAYWGYTALRNIQTVPGRLSQILNRSADITAMPRDEINTLAARYLRDDGAFLFKTTPAKK